MDVHKMLVFHYSHDFYDLNALLKKNRQFEIIKNHNFTVFLAQNDISSPLRARQQSLLAAYSLDDPTLPHIWIWEDLKQLFLSPNRFKIHQEMTITNHTTRCTYNYFAAVYKDTILNHILDFQQNQSNLTQKLSHLSICYHIFPKVITSFRNNDS